MHINKEKKVVSHPPILANGCVISISLCYLGVAGMPLFLALSLSPILSIQVPQLKRFPPWTKPVAGSTLITTLNPRRKNNTLTWGDKWSPQHSNLFNTFLCFSIFCVFDRPMAITVMCTGGDLSESEFLLLSIAFKCLLVANVLQLCQR